MLLHMLVLLPCVPLQGIHTTYAVRFYFFTLFVTVLCLLLPSAWLGPVEWLTCAVPCKSTTHAELQRLGYKGALLWLLILFAASIRVLRC
jgi:hypothetical protein